MGMSKLKANLDVAMRENSAIYMEDNYKQKYGEFDWLEITKSQLKKWGCKYHKLDVGNKPDYDLLICDKTKRIEETSSHTCQVPGTKGPTLIDRKWTCLRKQKLEPMQTQAKYLGPMRTAIRGKDGTSG